jgi:DNA-binding response OmpR family regulator
MLGTILSIRSKEAVESTRLLLEQQGFRVISATDFKQVEAACAEAQFDLVLIGDAIEPKIKKAIVALLRDRRSAAPVLELYHGKPELEDVYSVDAVSPDDLIASVNRVLKQVRSSQSA